MKIPTEDIAKKLKALGYKPQMPLPGFYVDGKYRTTSSFVGFPKDPIFAPYYFEIWEWLSSEKKIKIEVFYDQASKKWIAQVETTKKFIQREGDTQEEALIAMVVLVIRSLSKNLK